MWTWLTDSAIKKRSDDDLDEWLDVSDLDCRP